MKNKILKISIAIILIMTLTMTNFLFLGSSMISYAINNQITNHQNVEFDVYFKDKEGKKVSTLETSFTDTDGKVYVQVNVKKEGYFNGSITLENSNFQLKETQSPYVNKMENNTILLNQMNAGTSAEIEISIEPIQEEQFKIGLLTISSHMKLEGIYRDSTQKDIKIKADREIALQLTQKIQEEQVKNNLEVITNKIVKINGEDKRVLQLSLELGLHQNEYPIQEIVSNIHIPTINGKSPEITKMVTLNTMTSYDMKQEGENIIFTLKNEPTSEQKVMWKKQGNETILVTCIYDKEVELKEKEISHEEKVTMYDQQSITSHKKVTLDNKEIDSIVGISSKNKENSFYKGKLYAGIERNYITATELKVNLSNVAEAVVVKEETLTSGFNIKYSKTVLKKEQFESLFGKEGTITIRNEKGEILAIITSSTSADENGNIIIDYQDKNVQALEIKTSAPITEGTMLWNHIKTIANNSKDKVSSTNEINQKVEISYNQYAETEKAKLDKYSKGTTKEVETKIELKEAKTEVKLELNKESLSTAVQNNIEMKAILVSNDEQYLLYQNPVIEMELPEEVEKIEIVNINLLYENELKVKNYEVQGRTIKVYLEGTQTQYKEAAIEGANLIINANVSINKKSATKDSRIKMTCQNEGAIQSVEQGIKVMAPKEVTTINSIKELKVETMGQEEKKTVTLARGEKKQVIEPQIEIINNQEEAIENVKVMGRFPTKNDNNTMMIKITEGLSISNSENVKVYYTENEKANDDLANSQNGWTETMTSAENVKKYLIIIDKIEEQSSIEVSYQAEIPENLEYNQSASEGYEVSYANSITKVTSQLKSTEIEMQTGIGPKVDTKLEATVSGNKIEANTTVKNGEVIEYQVQVANVGTEDMSQIKVTGTIPEGTTLVKPEENYEYTGASYYKEYADKHYEETIDSLKVGEVITKKYEVRVNKDTKVGTKLTNKAQVSYGDVKKETNEVSLQTESAKVRVSAKRVTDRNVDLYAASTVQYFAIVENMTNEKQNDVKVKTNLSNNLEVARLAIITGMKSEEVPDDDIHKPNAQNQTTTEPREITEQELTANVEDTTKIEYIEYQEEITIGTLEPGEVKVLSYDLIIKKMENNNSNINFSVTIKNGNEETNSNQWTDNIQNYKIQLVMTANTESKYIKAGDVVTYTITAKNEGTSEAKGIILKDSIPNQMTIQKVTKNGETVEGITNNQIEISCDVPAGETITITIEAVVNYSEGREEAEPIVNSAYAELFGEKIATTTEINHIIEANPKDETKPDGDDNNNNQDNDVAEGSKIITGIAWYDENGNGKKDTDEKLAAQVKVKLLNTKTNHFIKDKTGKVLEATTNENGVYVLNHINQGTYIVIFEYDQTQYTLTRYKVEGVAESENSDVMLNEITIDDGKQKVAATDILEVKDENVSDINIGFIKLQNFDLALDKYVSKILIQNKAGTTVKEYNNETTAKAEIDAKQLNGTTVIIEYKIKVTNTGEVDGYVKKVADYMSNDLKFSSELNKDWYQTGDTLYNSSLANDKLAAGESKTLTLTLTKTMTENNTGLIPNTAEIAEDYNELGIKDTNSTPGNKTKGENDMGAADVILSIRTGGFVPITITIIAVAVLGATAVIITKRKKNEKEI